MPLYYLLLPTRTSGLTEVVLYRSKGANRNNYFHHRPRYRTDPVPGTYVFVFWECRPDKVIAQVIALLFHHAPAYLGYTICIYK